MFSPNDTEFVDDTVTGVLDGTLEDHRWLASETEDGTVIALMGASPSSLNDTSPPTNHAGAVQPVKARSRPGRKAPRTDDEP